MRAATRHGIRSCFLFRRKVDSIATRLTACYRRFKLLKLLSTVRQGHAGEEFTP